MDGYTLGFVLAMGFMLLVSLGALIFTSLDFDGEATSQDTRINYHTVRVIDTNTIETIDALGEVERWQRST